MNKEIESLLQIFVLLEHELRDGEKATSQLDLRNIEHHTNAAALLCDQLHSLISRRVFPQSDENREHLRGAAHSLAEVCSAYRCLLRKSRRTANVLMNVISTASLAYTVRSVQGSTRQGSGL